MTKRLVRFCLVAITSVTSAPACATRKRPGSSSNSMDSGAAPASAWRIVAAYAATRRTRLPCAVCLVVDAQAAAEVQCPQLCLPSLAQLLEQPDHTLGSSAEGCRIAYLRADVHADAHGAQTLQPTRLAVEPAACSIAMPNLCSLMPVEI